MTEPSRITYLLFSFSVINPLIREFNFEYRSIMFILTDDTILFPSVIVFEGVTLWHHSFELEVDDVAIGYRNRPNRIQDVGPPTIIQRPTQLQ